MTTHEHEYDVFDELSDANKKIRELEKRNRKLALSVSTQTLTIAELERKIVDLEETLGYMD